MAKCKSCNKKGLFLRVNKDGICTKCEKKTESEDLKFLKSMIQIGPTYVGTSTGDKVRNDYYVYQWKIKDTGEIFYVGKGRGNRANTRHERAYEAESIKDRYETEVIIIAENLTEQEALQIENDEMLRILNETTHRLTNRVTPIRADRDNGYAKASSTPKYEFEKASTLYANEIEEHYFDVNHRQFDKVNEKQLLRPHFVNKSLNVEELEVVYGGNYNQYLQEVKFMLNISGAKPLKTKFAKSVTCWIYSTDDYVSNYLNDQEKASERMDRNIPSYHLIDVWKFLKKQYGDIEVTNQTNIDLKPVYSRIDLDKIRNKGNWQKGYDEGYKLWEQGNQLRKDGNLLEALELLDKARSVGYDAPALYNSYAMLFRKLKCYDDEILILLEAKERNEKLGSSVATAVTKWDERINRAMELRNP